MNECNIFTYKTFISIFEIVAKTFFWAAGSIILRIRVVTVVVVVLVVVIIVLKDVGGWVGGGMVNIIYIFLFKKTFSPTHLYWKPKNG